MKTEILCGTLAALTLLWHPQAAAERAVIEFVQVETGERTAEYLEKLGGVLERMKEIQPLIRSRVFRATYAGTDTGTIYVVNEFPSMSYFAESLRAFENDPEYLQGLAELRRTGRILSSESLLVEVTPNQKQDKD